jgi:hypothetical protein
LDLTELSVFRALKEPLGGALPALHFFWLLWRDLAQLSQEGLPLGRMKVANVDAFLGLLVELGRFSDQQQAREFLEKSVIATGLLTRDGEDLTCPRFVMLNPELAFKPRESRGGLGRAYALKMQRFEKTLIQGGLRLPANVFVEADGTPLETEMVQRIQRLVVSCDNALKRDRPPIGWTESLVALALLVVRKHTDEQIGWVCHKLALNCEAAILNGMTTEKLLPKFDTICSDLGET